MGIMDFFKGELIEIIEWTDDSRDTLSYRFPTMTRRSRTGRSSSFASRSRRNSSTWGSSATRSAPASTR